MKKILFILIMIAILATAGYFALRINDKSDDPQSSQYTTYAKDQIDIKFSYRVGPSGYVLEERISADTNNVPVRTLTLFRTEDKLEQPPIGGEGPPVIAIIVFKNIEKIEPREWADKNIQYSNINLKIGDVIETKIGGQKAVRYMADGLYASENAIVTKGDYVYVITGQYISADSDIRRDYEPLLSSIRF